MTEIEKAVKEFGWGCIREGLLNPHLRLALLAAITRREAEVRAEALEEAGREAYEVLAAEASDTIPLALAGRVWDSIRALIKEQP